MIPSERIYELTKQSIDRSVDIGLDAYVQYLDSRLEAIIDYLDETYLDDKYEKSR